LRSITDNFYENPRFTHKRWLAPIKCNIALAEDTKSAKDVVLKLYDGRPDFDHELRFLEILSKKASSFVVELKDSIEPCEGSSERRHCIVMEELAINLHEYLESHPQLDRHTRVALAHNLVKAIDALHQAKVIHGDLKPHQLCFTKQPGIIALKLIDFDSARSSQEPIAPLDRYTTMYAAPEVVRAAAACELPNLVPTKGVDLWPLGLMLAQIFDHDMKTIFSTDEDEAQVQILKDPAALIALKIDGLGGIKDAVQGLLQMDPRDRWSASKVSREDIFNAGAFTLIHKVNKGQEIILERQATLEDAIKATQRIIVEYGDTPIPRMAVLVPDDPATNGKSSFKGLFSRLASNSGAMKCYNLYLMCEGCTLFPSTECSCGNVLGNPVRVKMPGAMLKSLVPALKAAAVLFIAASVAGNVAGVRLPVNLPGIGDMVDFAEAVNEFIELAEHMGAPLRGTADAEDHSAADLALKSGTRAYGPAYAALADLLKSSGVVPKDNTCQGLHKVVDQADGKVYWVCKAHADAHTDRLWGANTTPPAVPKEEPAAIGTAIVSASTIADSLESAKRSVAAQEIKISKLWTGGKYADATREVPGLVNALEALARVSDEWAQFATKAATLAKETKAKGFQGKSKAKLNGRGSIHECQGGCALKKFSSPFSPRGKPKRNCKVCGEVVCEECSPPPKLLVQGYPEKQRVCKKCIGARDLEIQELDEEAKEAAAQSATARENAQRAKDDDKGIAPPSDVSGASSFLNRAISAAKADNDLSCAGALQCKLAEVLKASPAATLVLAIALEAFPVNAIVRTSVDRDGMVAGTAGEVVGHTASGKVIVQFKAGKVKFKLEFDVAALTAAVLPNGWTVKQTCYSVVELPGKLSKGQPGFVMGWSKPFDCEKIMADFDGRQMNVQLNQIETVEQFNKVCANPL